MSWLWTTSLLSTLSYSSHSLTCWSCSMTATFASLSVFRNPSCPISSSFEDNGTSCRNSLVEAFATFFLLSYYWQSLSIKVHYHDNETINSILFLYNKKFKLKCIGNVHIVIKGRTSGKFEMCTCGEKLRA